VSDVKENHTIICLFG